MRKIILVNEFEVCFQGPIHYLQIHEHITWTLCIPLETSLTINFHERKFEVKDSILIPPHVPHSVQANGQQVFFLFFERYSVFLTNQDQFQMNSPLAKETVLGFREKLKSSVTPQELKTYYLDLIKKNNFSTLKSQQTDKRIQEALVILHSQEIKSIGLPDLASELGISESRLSHLFREQVGVPISTYRTWIKIKALAAGLRQGQNLTFAAQEAGFFDSAHLIRIFRKYFGLSPKSIFQSGEIIWL